jgi:hypothetical protein
MANLGMHPCQLIVLGKMHLPCTLARPSSLSSNSRTFPDRGFRQSTLLFQITCRTISIAVNPHTKRKRMERQRIKVQPSCVDLRMTRQAHTRRKAEIPSVNIGFAKSHCQKRVRLASIVGNHSKLNRRQRAAQNCWNACHACHA